MADEKRTGVEPRTNGIHRHGLPADAKLVRPEKRGGQAAAAPAPGTPGGNMTNVKTEVKSEK